MAKKADIAINTIFVVALSIISILFLIFVFSTKFSTFGKDIYCKTFFYIHSSTFMPESLRAEKSYCQENKGFRTEQITREIEHLNTFGDGKSSMIIKKSPAQNFLRLPKDAEVTSFKYSLSSNSDVENMFIAIYVGDLSKNFTVDVPLFNPKLSPSSFGGEYSAAGFNSYISECTNDFCDIPLRIYLNGTDLKIFNIDVTYKKCFVEEHIIAEAVACYKEVNFGEYTKDKICVELSISPTCQKKYMDQAEATAILQRDGYCEVLPNSDYDCGESDALNWDIGTELPGHNVMVKFNSLTKQIEVS